MPTKRGVMAGAGVATAAAADAAVAAGATVFETGTAMAGAGLRAGVDGVVATTLQTDPGTFLDE